MKLFLSYPSTLHPIVENICDHLPQGAFQPWLDTEQIKAGASIPDKVSQNIRDSEYFISFLNADALKSDWIRKELDLAVVREQALGRPFIIPILFQDFPKKKLPKLLLHQRRFLSYRGTNYPRQIAAFTNELADELLRLACERPSLRCEGMAAVYFFSFVEPFVKGVWSADNLRLKWDLGERSLKDLKPMELRILLPEIVDELNLNDLLKELRLREGVLLDGDKTIFRRVCFGAELEQRPEAAVIFYDVPNILNSAAKLFAQERSNPDWEKINRMEILAFKYHLERLADKNITKPKIRAAVKVGMLTDPQT